MVGRVVARGWMGVGDESVSWRKGNRRRGSAEKRGFILGVGLSVVGSLRNRGGGYLKVEEK